MPHDKLSTAYLKVGAVARHLGISTRQTYRLIELGEIKAHKFGANATRVHIDDLKDFEERTCAA